MSEKEDLRFLSKGQVDNYTSPFPKVGKRVQNSNSLQEVVLEHFVLFCFFCVRESSWTACLVLGYCQIPTDTPLQPVGLTPCQKCAAFWDSCCFYAVQPQFPLPLYSTANVSVVTFVHTLCALGFAHQQFLSLCVSVNCDICRACNFP